MKYADVVLQSLSKMILRKGAKPNVKYVLVISLQSRDDVN